MEREIEIFDALTEVSQRIYDFLQNETDGDLKLEALAAYLDDREPLINQLEQLPAVNDSQRIEKLRFLDDYIRQQLKSLMTDTQNSIAGLKTQRESLVKHKHSQASYHKQLTSTEGFFFDKKK